MWLFESIQPHEHIYYKINLFKCIFDYLWSKVDKFKMFQNMFTQCCPSDRQKPLVPGVNRARISKC